jgi:hypothetical protein
MLVMEKLRKSGLGRLSDRAKQQQKTTRQRRLLGAGARPVDLSLLIQLRIFSGLGQEPLDGVGQGFRRLRG